MDENIKVITNHSDIVAIADAVRSKTGNTGKMTLGGIASGINSIKTGVEPEGSITITENGTHDVKNYANAIVDVESGSGGVDLPELTNPAIEDEVFLNKEYIDSSGEKKIGTFSIDNELNVQDDIIAQIQAIVEQKAIYNTVYVGTSVPTNDIGVDGDIYIEYYDETPLSGNKVGITCKKELTLFKIEE